MNVSSDLGSFRCFHDRSRAGAFVGTPPYAASKAAINMITVQFASLLPKIRINAADPGLTATDLSGGHGHSVHGTDAIIAYALAARGGPAAPSPTATAPFPGNSAVRGNRHRPERN